MPNKEFEVKFVYAAPLMTVIHIIIMADGETSTSFFAPHPYLLMEVIEVTVPMFYCPFMLSICHLDDINLKYR